MNVSKSEIGVETDENGTMRLYLHGDEYEFDNPNKALELAETLSAQAVIAMERQGRLEHE